MAINHSVVKAPGETLAAIIDWNANHVITDPDTAKRSVTLTVAAFNSLDKVRADYVCDHNNDEVEILQAIADLPANGGTVLLLEGEYRLQGNLEWNRASVTMRGMGYGTYITMGSNYFKPKGSYASVIGIKFKSTSLYRFSFEGWYGFLSHCYFDGSSIKINNGNCRVENNYFKAGVYAIHFRMIIIGNVFDGKELLSSCSQGVVIADNVVYNNFIKTTKDNAVISGNFVYNGDIIIEANSKQCTVSGNVLEAGGKIHCKTGTYGNSITGNVIYFPNDIGLEIDTSHRNTIVGNVITSPYYHGIKLNASNNNVVSGNMIHDASRQADNTWDGINLTGTSTYNIITGNRINNDAANNQRYGIREEAAADDWNCVTGNICTDAVTADISLQGVNDEEAHNIIET